MKKKILFLISVAAVMVFLPAQVYHRPYTITIASVDTGDANAAALDVAFKAITIRADPNNAGAVCVGISSSMSCDAGIADNASAGFKLYAGEAVTIGDGAWAASTLYLCNTSANDYVTYIAMN